MVPDLAGRFRFQHLPACGQRRHPQCAFIFKVYERSAFQPLAGIQLRKALRQRVLAEWRIKKDEVKGLARRAQKARGAERLHARAREAAQALELRTQGVGGSGHRLDKNDLGSTAR